MRIAAAVAFLILTTAIPAIAAECSKPLGIISSLPMEWVNNHLVLPVKIDGKDVKMGLSTGDANTLISPAAAADLGLRTEESNRRIFSANGGIGGTAAQVRTLSIGAMTGTDVWFLLTPNTNLPPAIAGLIGTDILVRVDVDLDFGANKINLISQDHCDGGILYWKPDTVGILSTSRIRQGKYKVPVTIDGHTFDAVLDTGQPLSNMPAGVAQNIFGLTGSSPGMRRIGTQTGTGDAVYRHVFAKMTFGGVEVSHARFNIVPDNAAKNIRLTDTRNKRALDARLPEVTIGMNVLRKLHVYFAFNEGKVYLSSAANGVPAEDSADNPAADPKP